MRLREKKEGEGKRVVPCKRISFPKRRREKRSAYKGQLSSLRLLRLGKEQYAPFLSLRRIAHTALGFS